MPRVLIFDINRYEENQAKVDAMICACGHIYGIHAGHGHGCLECNGKCLQFHLPGEEVKTRFLEGAEL